VTAKPAPGKPQAVAPWRGTAPKGG
jgi:hypothetical protein